MPNRSNPRWDNAAHLPFYCIPPMKNQQPSGIQISKQTHSATKAITDTCEGKRFITTNAPDPEVTAPHCVNHDKAVT